MYTLVLDQLCLAQLPCIPVLLISLQNNSSALVGPVSGCLLIDVIHDELCQLNSNTKPKLTDALYNTSLAWQSYIIHLAYIMSVSYTAVIAEASPTNSHTPQNLAALRYVAVLYARYAALTPQQCHIEHRQCRIPSWCCGMSCSVAVLLISLQNNSSALVGPVGGCTAVIAEASPPTNRLFNSCLNQLLLWRCGL
eukprot:GHVQ01035816.1.p1 GENE.GHVQ01035816.1~~GHVQ01035816.1.p1  ORF type:complete len:195 (-),score=28.87 GHVQ01035816.1:503-1087(-)